MPLNPQARKIVGAFGHQPGVTQEQLDNLQQAIDASPELIRKINAAVEKKQLSRMLPQHQARSADIYDHASHDLFLPLMEFDSWSGCTLRRNRAVAILGRHLHHVTRGEDISRIREELRNKAYGPIAITRDYTDAIEKFITGYLRIEAGAAISSWNALVSAESKPEPGYEVTAPSIAQLYLRSPIELKRAFKVDRSQYPPIYSLHPHLQFDDDLRMAPSSRNAQVMADICGNLHLSGHHRNSNCANHYAALAINDLLLHEYHREHSRLRGRQRPGLIRIDMAKLQLSPQLLAENGIRLTGQRSPMYYVDRSTEPPAYAMLWETSQSHAYRSDAPSLEHQLHPGHALYRGALAAIADSPATRDLGNRKEMAAALAVKACEAQVRVIDHIVIHNNRLCAGKFDQKSTSIKFATLDLHTAADRSFEQSSMECLGTYDRAAELAAPKHPQQRAAPSHQPKPRQP